MAIVENARTRMQTMTPRQRMLAAYRGEPVDTVPVAPEFWYYIPARVLGVDMVTLEREMPHWEALWKTFRHYGTEGWGIVGTPVPVPDVSTIEKWTDLGDGQFESLLTTRTRYGEMTTRYNYSRKEPCWAVERPIKDIAGDWPGYKAATIGGLVEETDWSSVQNALDTVGEDYLLEVCVGVPFFDYMAGGRQGGLEQGIFDLMEHGRFFEELHEEYTDYMRGLTRAAFVHTTAQSVCLGCCWSCVSLIGPSLWRRWDLPVIRAVAEEAHAAGKLVHLHYHGKCHDVLQDLAECGADCICPFERPPGGDITDLAETRRLLKGKVTVNGSVHTVETLIRGSVDDVRREIEEIFEQWGAPYERLIIGTGDQVGMESPDENIYAMIDTVRKLGKTC